MNKFEMKKILDDKGIKENIVYEMTDTNIGDLLGIEQTKEGWSLYYSERGRKDIIMLFDNEDSACKAMLQKISQRMAEDYGIDISFHEYE